MVTDFRAAARAHGFRHPLRRGTTPLRREPFHLHSPVPRKNAQAGPRLDREYSPAIALEQKNHVVNSRSTVGTQTEIVDYMRVLFAKIGHTHCVDCGTRSKAGLQTILDWAAGWLPAQGDDLTPVMDGASDKEEAPKPKKKSKAERKTKASAKKWKAQMAGTRPQVFSNSSRTGLHPRTLERPKKGRPRSWTSKTRDSPYSRSTA